MRKNLIVLTGKLIIILLLMSGVNFSRHYCLPSSSIRSTEMKRDCCGTDCSSSKSDADETETGSSSCCKLVASFLYFPVYSLCHTFSPEPIILTLAVHSSNVQCILLEGREVSNPSEIALKGEPPGPDITLLRVFRI